MANKYLTFCRDDSYKGKTEVYQIYNNESEELLGAISWHCAWRQYCFFPDQGTFWSNGCLQEVKDFIGKIMVERIKNKDALVSGGDE